MSIPDLKHLFVPGDGNVPPYLAGRKEEQAYFQDCVDVLKNKKPAPRNLIVYGPRGNGKTALLEYLQTRTRQKEKGHLEILWLTPDQIATPADLARILKGKNKLKGLLRNVTGSVGTWFGSASIGVDLSASSSVELEDQIRNKCQHKAFILIIDEAHTLTPAVARALLNASQSVRNAGNPFLLVLAGTPNLSAALGQANASFWDRSKKWPLGRLSPEEAGQALTIPLQEVGITFTPDVIEHIVAQTHCYPFFIQVWGDCLARSLDQTRDTEITLETFKGVEAAVIDECDAMYDIRFSEIKRMGLLPVAERVAEAFSECSESILHGGALDKAIERGLAGDAPNTRKWGMEEALDQLSQLGYVWRIRVPGGYAYEPGIPSLMTYVNNQIRVEKGPR